MIPPTILLTILLALSPLILLTGAIALFNFTTFRARLPGKIQPCMRSEDIWKNSNVFIGFFPSGNSRRCIGHYRDC